jgi:predicted transcriptional regulator
MGEAKRKEERMSPVDRAALELTRTLANEGKLIEAGFAAYVAVNKIGIDDPALPALRDAYMSAAEHLWSSIMATLDAGDDPTSADMRRMDAIQAEIDAWRAQKSEAFAKAMATKGSA